ncbi:unnamed protein product [Clonostachys rhizophaga]|uniref:MARVEL domain-containing protein n=1 Tax=Clonostachys rhizophaga TaxID=160324 RepID=A0A9N9V599_9HYPO|nr:unnamed protein product [Clonostachys rhizophaga]
MSSTFFTILILLCALLWTLLITSLIGNVMANNINASSSATMAINFTMFVAAWAWVTALFGLAAALISSLAIPILLLALNGLAVLFTLVDAIVLSAKLGAPNCGHIRNEPRNWIAYGSNNNTKRCREIQASTVFMWFLFATFCVATLFSVKLLRSKSRGSTTQPSMSQTRV